MALNKKRLCSLVLAMVCTLLWACPVAAVSSATLTVGTVAACPGDTVTVPLSVSQIDGIGAVGIYVTYDTSMLECISAEAVGIMNDMDTNTANTAPVNRQGEVWLTGMCLAGISGSGDLMHMTFKVKESATDGFATIGFVAEKDQQLILVDGSLMGVTCTAGGVSIATEATVTESTAAPTAAATDASTAATDTRVPSGNEAVTPPTDANTSTTAVTRANGETVTVTEMTVVDANGTPMTTPQGEPLTMQSVAVMISEVTAVPGEQVTVEVALTAVSELSMFGIDVSYDTEMVTFVSGEMIGFVAENMNTSNVMSEQEGVVVLSGADPTGVSGEGAIARLTFEVKRTAKAGKCRLALSPDPILVAESSAQIPFVTYAGSITVGGAASSNIGLYVGLGIFAAAGVATAVALVVIQRKKNAAPTTASAATVEKAAEPEESESKDIMDE